MSTSRVLQFQEFRDRVERRVERASVLYSADRDRADLVPHLSAAISAAGGDRAALVWVDEYGPGLAHTHLVLDLASELPRRGFSVEPLRLAWSAGVPGLYDFPVREANTRVSVPWGARSICSVALGSDGLRAWFLVVDGPTPRGPLDQESTGRIMFAAGECSGVVMHRDLQRNGRSLLVPEGGADRFAGWPILKDIEGHEGDEATHRRISCRFLVARAVRTLLDEDLGIDHESFSKQIAAVRRELRDQLHGDREREIWEEILEGLEAEALPELAGALVALGEWIEDRGHFSGAREFYRGSYEVAVAAGDEVAALEAARLAGRACRRQANWDPALGWYDVARRLSRSIGEKGKEALVLDGKANVHRERGNLPRARETLLEALDAARLSGDVRALGNVYQNLMSVSGLVGDFEGAVRFGWQAVQTHGRGEDGLKALTGLAMAFLAGGDLDAAEDAYAVVAKGVERLEYRLYALSGYAQVSGLRGDEPEFRRRLAALDVAGFQGGSPTFRAEAHVELGHVFQRLGCLEEAEARYRMGLDVARRHGLNQFAFHAEKALETMTSAPEVHQPEPPPNPTADIVEIRGELRSLREAAGAPL